MPKLKSEEYNTETEIDEGSDRAPRDLETRDSSAHEPLTYLPSGLLPEINRQEGYEYRWVRISSRGVDDKTNLNARLREGWVPCKAEDHPEYQTLMTDNDTSRFKGLIEHGGLLLCKIAKERSQVRRKYYQDRARKQIESVDNNVMRESDRRMPMFKESRSTVSNRGDR